MKKISNIVCDIGNVLCEFYPKKILDNLFPDSPHKNLYLKTIFEDPRWLALDDGSLTKDEVLNHLSSVLNQDQFKDIQHLLEKFVDHMPIISQTQELFESLIGHYPIYILSNFQDKPWDKFLAKNPFLSKANGIVISARVKMKKPDKAIYHHLLNSFNLIPEETVFIDDKKENILACEQVGMTGIEFKNPDDLIRSLSQLNIKIPIHGRFS